MNIYKKLTSLQNELQCGKNNYNAFGKYKYRTCSDVLEALKPLLLKHGLATFINDELVYIDGRFYIKATVKVINIDKTDEMIEASALAREGDSQSGMSPAQITGSASSYARKYALNAMFNIDDVEDDDVTNTHGKEEVESGTVKKELTRNEMIEVFNSMAKEKRDAILAEYNKDRAKPVSDGKYLTTEFLRNAIK
jgi:hypothetical protein